MPIRLNLLAEVQAAEDVRRRDPVKRVGWLAALLVCLMLVWWSSLLLKAIVARTQIGSVEAQIASHTNDYQMVLNNQKAIADTDGKLGALRKLATSRLLQGSLLNALQQTTIDSVSLMHFRVDQNFVLTEEIKPKNINGRTVPGRPAMVTERDLLTFAAKDASPNPGDLLISRYRESIGTNDYFRKFTGGTNEVRLTTYSPPTAMPGEQTFVLFTVQCNSPDISR